MTALSEKVPVEDDAVEEARAPAPSARPAPRRRVDRDRRRVPGHRHPLRPRAAALRRGRRDGAPGLRPRDRLVPPPADRRTGLPAGERQGLAGRVGVARRRPLPRGVGGEPPAAQLHAVGAGDLVLELGRSARRRTAVPAPAERVARRRRRCADLLRRPRAQPRGPAARPARRGDGRPRSAGPRPVLPRHERRLGVRRRQRAAVGDAAMLPPPRVAARSPAAQRVRRGLVRVARGHDAAGDRAGRRGGGLGPGGARATVHGAGAHRRAHDARRAGSGQRGVRLVLRAQRAPLRRHRRLGLRAPLLPSPGGRVGAAHPRARARVDADVPADDHHRTARLARPAVRHAGRGARDRRAGARPAHPPPRLVARRHPAGVGSGRRDHRHRRPAHRRRRQPVPPLLLPRARRVGVPRHPRPRPPPRPPRSRSPWCWRWPAG